MTDVPVLVVAFNRPDRLADVLAVLRDVKPTRLYVAVDGPRGHVAGEDERVRTTREQVGAVDWECRVETLFRETNLGCGQGVSGAVSWLFQHEDRGIVLEDDILPDPSFFPFCAALLDRYEADERVWAVSGCSFVPPGAMNATGSSYRFSAVPHIWGWATWRRSWESYRLDARGWRHRLPPRALWAASGRSPWGALYWAGMFEMVARGAIDTWDVQAVLTAFTRGGLTATSNVNLVENVGFGAGSTHTEATPDYLLPRGHLELPIDHPADVRVDREADDWTRRHALGATPVGLAGQGYRFLRSRLARS